MGSWGKFNFSDACRFCSDNLDLDKLNMGATGLYDTLSDWSGGYGTAEGVDTERWWRGVSPPAKDLLDVNVASKSWSVMTGEEQLHAVEALTEAISRKLGLREQLDVIRIIDPSASVDPTADREFVVGQSSSGFFPADLASLELQ